MIRATIVIAAIAGLLLSETALAYISGAVASLLYVTTGQGEFLATYPRRIFSQLDVFAFMAMPFFILVGELMNRGGITQALVDFSLALVGRVRGGLGHVNVLTSLFFSGISGSAIADAAALSSTLVPAMREKGYDARYAAAITAASSIIGPIVPPSIILIFYGAIMGVDVAALFAAGIVPGVLLAGCLLIANGVFAWRGHHPGGDGSQPGFLQALPRAIPALALPVIILAGIVLGWMTPTEAAAVAVFAALGVGFLFRAVSRDMLRESLWRTITLSGSIFVMLAAAATINFLAAVNQVPDLLASYVNGTGITGPAFLFLLMGVFLVFGMLSETQIALAVAAPLLIPAAVAQGADPVHLGILVCLNLSMGLITPPLGGAVLVVSTITGVNYWALIKATFPFVLVELALLCALVAFPGLSLSLPRYFGLM